MRFRGKFGNKKTDGFDSKKEAKRYQELVLLEKVGVIRKLQTQVKFELTPKCGKERESSYIADFVYEECPEEGRKRHHWQEVVEDCKGFRTRDYILKRKFMLYRYGIAIREM